MAAEGIRGRNQQWRAAISAGAVGQHQSLRASRVRLVQEAANAGFFEWDHARHAGHHTAPEARRAYRRRARQDTGPRSGAKPPHTAEKWSDKQEVKVFPRTHHGFYFPERAVYD